ncbi:MAG: hypothetical protein HOV87_03595 [Catenulispora sp.]|nr:hypothetical protein [Catenulispora sp.]
MSQEAWTGLAAAIKAVRAELLAAVDDGTGLRFQPGPVELEFSIDVHTDAKGEASVVLLPWIRAGGGSGQSHGTGHRLKVTLQPVDEDGGEIKISASVSARPE